MTELIKISKRNEAYLKLDCDISVIMEMSDKFTFEVPGAKFSPAYKMGKWDGKIRLMNVGSRTIYSGLLEEIKSFAKEREYDIELVSNEYGTPGERDPITLDEVKAFMDGLNITARGVSIDIRDYQYKAVHEALADQRGIICASVGAGKSMILYAFVRYVTDELRLRTLIVVPTVSLTTQLFSDFEDYAANSGWSVSDHVHLISAGASKTTKKPVVISTYQSIAKLDSEWVNSFDCLFADEGHLVTSNSIKGLYEKGTEVKYRLACTGTIHEMKCNVLTMIGLTGPIKDIASTKTLIDAGQLVPLKVYAIQLGYTPEVRKAMKGKDYETEIGYIVTNARRNRFIAKLANRCTGTTLVLFRFVDNQGKPLYDMVKELAGDRPTYYIDGSVDSGDREVIRKMANTDNGIIVASYGVFSTGINLPAIGNIILAHPMKSKITILQSIGRGLRLMNGKTHCNLYDIGDDMSIKSYTNYGMDHLGARLKMYMATGFEYSTVHFDI